MSPGVKRNFCQGLEWPESEAQRIAESLIRNRASPRLSDRIQLLKGKQYKTSQFAAGITPFNRFWLN